jgi:hypothetical protein
LFAKVCAEQPCSPSGGDELALPARARAGVPKARLNVVGIGAGRRAVVVTVPDAAPGSSWQAVIAAPLGGAKPKIVFQGWTGFIAGEEGERRGPVVMISELEPGEGRHVVVGEQREDLTLCGRPALLSPKVLAADDLALKPAKMQRLTGVERGAAKRLTARRLADDAPAAPAAAGLLRAVAASSAIGSPAALTDGDPETTWAENRGGDGRGEFVLMNAPADLPLTGFELVIRPPKSAPAGGAAPRELWMATSKELFHVTLPDDAWKSPGARYEVTLEKPVQSDCWALVTESSFDTKPAARVTFAELRAKTEFDAAAVENLIGALAGGGERAQAAAAVLRASGQQAYQALAKAFTRLDEGGRRVALAVIDTAPCSISVDVYLHALLGKYPAQRTHAEDRLRRCADPAAERMIALFSRVKVQHVPTLANELSLLAPGRAPRVIALKLDSPDPELRRELRVALARAASSPRATASLKELLRDPSLSEAALVDVLRALAPRLGALLPESAQAFNRIATPRASFRTRFLLLEAAAELDARDPGARAFMRRSIAIDESPHVRARAAAAVRSAPEYKAELLRAIEDREVRVREAAITTLGQRGQDFAGASIVSRLKRDEWPLIRAAAADALSLLGKSAEFDAALGDSIDDPSPQVRGPVIRALGARRAMRHAPEIRERLDDDDEAVIVRASAAAALGLMCDAGSLDVLTRQAVRLKDPLLSADLRSIAPIALASLSRIHPPDLGDRLSPLRGRDVPEPARRAAEAALATPGGCGK